MKVKIALVQMQMNDDCASNLAVAKARIEKAAGMGANLICLPELFLSPYFPRVEKFPEVESFLDSVPGLFTSELSELARKNKVVIIAGSIYEEYKNHKFNTSVVIDADGKILGKYRKVHIPHDPNFYEQLYFKPGDLGFKVFQTKYGKVAPLICYDQWFPEAARSVALQGAEIIFYPTAIGTVKEVNQIEGNWQEAWEAVQRGHAIANNVVVATINRCGFEEDMNFWGGSFVYDQFGTLKAHACAKEEILLAEIDLNLQKEVREGWRFFKERKPKEYKVITDEKLVGKK